MTGESRSSGLDMRVLSIGRRFDWWQRRGCQTVKFRNKMDEKKMSVMCAKPELHQNRVGKSEFRRRATFARESCLTTLADTNMNEIGRE
jgi:hypothetical protein